MIWHRLRAGHYWSVALLPNHPAVLWPSGLVLAEVSLLPDGQWVWHLTIRATRQIASGGHADTLFLAEREIEQVLGL